VERPLQELVVENGVLRFKENAIVRAFLDWARPRGFGMNELATMDFTPEDRRQFAQLIGYSLSGYGELPYVSSTDYEAARTAFEEDLSSKDARIAYLELELERIKHSLREPIARLYDIHPDDLK
jgi:hypothetical protein